jgi:hypothetical protein
MFTPAPAIGLPVDSSFTFPWITSPAQAESAAIRRILDVRVGINERLPLHIGGMRELEIGRR